MFESIFLSISGKVMVDELTTSITPNAQN